MLDKKTHFKFSSKVNKIMKDCLIQDNLLDGSDMFSAHGYTPLTKDNNYTYSMSRAQKHIPELIDLCKILPIMKSNVEGSVGVISYTDLITEFSTADTQLKAFVVADHFVNLLNVTGIAPVTILTRDEKTLACSVLNPKYRSQFLQTKKAQEPDEK